MWYVSVYATECTDISHVFTRHTLVWQATKFAVSVSGYSRRRWHQSTWNFAWWYVYPGCSFSLSAEVPPGINKSEILSLHLFLATWPRICANISKTVSRSVSVTCQLALNVAQCRQFQEDSKDASVSECTWTLSALEALRNALYKFKTYLLTYFLKCKSRVVAPRGVNYKQKYVAFFKHFCIIICDKRETHWCVAERHLCIARRWSNTIGRIPSKCWRHVTSSSDGRGTRRQLRVFHRPPALDTAVNCNTAECAREAYNQRRRCCHPLKMVLHIVLTGHHSMLGSNVDWRTISDDFACQSQRLRSKSFFGEFKVTL